MAKKIKTLIHTIEQQKPLWPKSKEGTGSNTQYQKPKVKTD